MNNASNYIRVDTLSFNSIELYMLLLLFMIYIGIFKYVKDKFSIKIIYMYLLALPYTDIVYRFHSIQISELLIFVLLVYDLLHFKIVMKPESALIKYMTFLSLLFLSSTAISFIRKIYTDNDYGMSFLPQYSILNNIKFILMVYMMNRILVEIKHLDHFQMMLKAIRISGNITAITTIMQVILYKLGYVVPGIFNMWGIPRAKGLSHEPATNAFVLLMTITISTMYIYHGYYRIHYFSLGLQLAAFLICFSTGAMPILILWFVLFKILSHSYTKTTFKRLMLLLILILLGCPIILCKYTDAFTELINKVSALGNDYIMGTNVSGRGQDILMVKQVMGHDLLFGVGAFNSNALFKNSAALTNCYMILLVELGLVGFIVLFIATLYFIQKALMHSRRIRNIPIYINVVSYMLVSFIAIGWLRVIFFHQIWVVLTIYFVMNKKLRRLQ